MIPLLVAAAAFVCVMIGALVGLWLGQRVPEHCRTEDSREAIQVAAGMISFLAALVLGLLTASIQSNFDTTNSQINGFAAQLAMLDQTLSIWVRKRPRRAGSCATTRRSRSRTTGPKKTERLGRPARAWARRS